MAVEKKNYWLRHIILVIIVAIVLFPMVWLISTSIRRDQAAFSPKLFSSRITLQHYRNLLFPERSIPRLILDVQEATYLLGRFRDKSEEKIISTVERYMNKFDKLMAESEGLVSTIDDSFSSLSEELNNSGLSEAISTINAIRKDDLELVEQRLLELKLDKNSELYLYALGNILNKTKPSIKDKYLFYVSNSGEYGKEVLTLAEELKKTYGEILNKRDELLTLLETENFDEKPLVIESLKRTEKYLSEKGVEYSSWRKTEWFKVINKYLRTLEKEIPEERANIINATRKAMYNSFKAANSLWDDFAEAHNALVNGLLDLKEKALGPRFVEYEETTQRLDEIAAKKSAIEKTLEKDELAIKEIEDALETVTPIIVPEAERLKILRTTIEKSLKETAPESPSSTLSDFFEKLRELYSRVETVKDSIEKLNLKDSTLYAGVADLYTELNWFLSNETKISAFSDDPDVKRAIDIFEVSRANIERALPDLIFTLNEAKEINEKAMAMKNNLITLSKESGVLQQKISELQEGYLTALQKLENYKQGIELGFVKKLANKSINSIDDAATYFENAADIIETYFDKKKNLRYRAYTWYEDFQRAYQEALEGSRVLSSAITTLSEMKENLESKIYDYIHLRFLGTQITLETFTNMVDSYNKSFQIFNARYQRASRLVSDLLDYPANYAAQYSHKLKALDKALFRVNQIWAQKETTYFYFVRWIGNSVLVALMVSLISVTVAALAAYPFSRMRFPGRSQGLLFLLLIQMFPSIMFMVAVYALLQFIGNYVSWLGLDSLGGLIFVYSGGIAFNTWLIKGYFDTIPDSLEESAMIDGATRLQTFWKIVIPLARPILAVIAILTFMGIFNEFIMARILLQDINKWTYAVGLQQFSGRFETSWGPFTAAALIGAIPMVTFFLILQDYIVGGLTKGAVKG